MPTTVTVSERYLGRKTSGKSAERSFIISGATNEAEALSALLTNSAVPVGVNGFVRLAADCSVEELADGQYLGTAVYGNPDFTQRDPGNFTISFDISGQTQKITQSLATIHKYTRPSSWQRDFKGAINVNSDGSVEGCDILVPVVNYTVNYTFPQTQFDDGTYIRKLMAAVGSVNSDSFKGLAPGEGLLSRVSGQRRADKAWDLSFGFGVSLNVSSDNGNTLTVGDITDIEKDGWDYLWVYYAEEQQTAAGGVNYVTKLPVHAFVERVYRRTAFANLGLS
jgi:hypothetical protein